MLFRASLHFLTTWSEVMFYCLFKQTDLKTFFFILYRVRLHNFCLNSQERQKYLRKTIFSVTSFFSKLCLEYFEVFDGHETSLKASLWLLSFYYELLMLEKSSYFLIGSDVTSSALCLFAYSFLTSTKAIL